MAEDKKKRKNGRMNGGQGGKHKVRAANKKKIAAKRKANPKPPAKLKRPTIIPPKTSHA